MAHTPWSLRPASDSTALPLGTSQPSVLIGPAWRVNQLESGRVVVERANYATTGSVAKRGWKPTINLSPPASQDPRIPAYNHLEPTLWHLRITTPEELAAFAASGHVTNVGQPVTYTPPGLASLLRTGI